MRTIRHFHYYYFHHSFSYQFSFPDYLPGGRSLEECLNNDRPFIKNNKQRIMAEIVLAVEELHRLNIIHCSIDLNNIQLDCNGHVVLCNYSASRDGSINTFVRHRTKYENFHDSIDTFDRNIDWWSVGEVWYQVLYFDIGFLENYPCEFIRKFITNEKGDPPKCLQFFKGIDWSNG